ncbi:hypothetical protein GA0070561_4128 [Micromonospora saelicesensis]|uniref:Uncharacterized protein n=1 Tax=Micromonospora saelicesensis TaxID=285676 RepID=A0A1C4YFK7_9ACTN|nr:hypothetical protein GA0070561_4128 [Micromonospora saelicesensis]
MPSKKSRSRGKRGSGRQRAPGRAGAGSLIELIFLIIRLLVLATAWSGAGTEEDESGY